MQMATISRWTLAFFGCALVALMLALVLLAFGYGYPNTSVGAPETLIVVHLITIGWLSVLMLGALLQFLPVLVGRELALPRLAPMMLAAIVSGLLLLLSGFGGLAGWPGQLSDLMPWGGALIVAGFLLGAIILFTTLLRSQSLPLPAGFVAVALMSALIAVMLGDTLASVLAGMIGGDFSVALVTHGLPLHAAFGLGGWLSLAAMGVSYRLVSMFIVAPERTGVLPRTTFGGALVALALLCAALGVLIAQNAPWPTGLGLAALAAVAAVVAYLGDIVALYRGRRRPKLELHMAAAIGAFAMLGLSVAALIWSVAAANQLGVAAAVYLLALGWLSGLGLAMLYKIVAFLTWLECFAPLMGRTPTPRVQDLVREDRALPGFVIYFSATVLGAGAVVFDAGKLLQVAAALQLGAVVLLVYQFYRARQLADLPDPWRAHPRPRVLTPATRPRSFS